MTDRQYGWVLAVVVTAVIAFLAVAMTFAARSAELDKTKFYLTVTITNEHGQVYTKLAYRSAGPWDTKEACEKWVPDEAFKEALPILLGKIAEAFGPAAGVHFSCEQPPAAPDEKV